MQEQMNYSGLYNGNIAWMSTDLAQAGEMKDDRAKGMQAMLYQYDQLNRITQARSLSSYTVGSGFASRTTGPAAYDVDYRYDANGNLLDLQRNKEDGSIQDDFVYDYYSGTNRLRNTAAADGDNYQYDAIGNLIRDGKEGTHIRWNPYGKIREVLTDSLVIHYRYDGTGNRVEKRTEKSGQLLTTRYIRDASGNIMGIYKDTVLTEQPIYGSSRLGQYRGGMRPGHRTLGKKQYELSNHLGNVLAVITDNAGMKTDSVWATVLSTSDYYPFGLEMKGRSYSAGVEYRYGFNGKEKDPEGMGGGGSTYDYGFRIYNPKIAKFLSVDPLTKEYPWYTPYQFAGNQPIWAIDLDGLEEFYYGDALEDQTFGRAKDLMITTDAGIKAYMTVWNSEKKAIAHDVYFVVADFNKINRNLVPRNAQALTKTFSSDHLSEDGKIKTSFLTNLQYEELGLTIMDFSATKEKGNNFSVIILNSSSSGYKAVGDGMDLNLLNYSETIYHEIKAHVVSKIEKGNISPEGGQRKEHKEYHGKESITSPQKSAVTPGTPRQEFINQAKEIIDGKKNKK